MSVGVLLSATFATYALANDVGVTDDTIKIGMFGPLTGPVAIYGYPVDNGAIAVYNEINEKGGINGRKIKVILEDGACDPAKARAAVKKLINRDKVFMIQGGSCSAAASAIRDLVIAQKLPYMVTIATEDKITKPVNPYIFTTVPTGTIDGQAMIDFVRSNPDIKRVAIVTHTDAWAHAKLDAIKHGIQEAGLELVDEEVLDRNATDATTQVLKIKESKPDVTIFVTYPGESAVFLRDAKKYGLKGPFVGSNAVMDMHDLADRAGGAEAVTDVYAAAYLKAPVKSDEMKSYADLMQKYFPNERLQSANFFAMLSSYTIIDAIKRAGPDLTRDSFLAALEATKDLPGQAAYCSVSYSAEMHQGCAKEQMWTLQDGKIVPVGDKWPAAKQ
jgi:branched-chain amino acid transport system substrate-binding protein